MILRPLRTWEYLPCLAAMRRFALERTAETDDEIWLVEHPPVFTQGLAGRAEHLLNPGAIPVVATERGGQVTYHGPGQVLAYLLLDLRRNGLMVRALVHAMESAVIATLAEFGLCAMRKVGAPGVYMARPTAAEGEATEAGAKISALGIKVTRGSTYHGLALNVAMDLEPFSRINPCGYAGLAVTDMRNEMAKIASWRPPPSAHAASEPRFEAPTPAAVADTLARQLALHLTPPR